MSIQFDNTAAGVVTLKPGASGSYSMTLPVANAAGALTNDGSGNMSFTSSGAAYTRTSFTATASQTSFTAAYTVGLLQVYVNGVLLNDTDYTATSGTAFVLSVACNVGDIVEAIAFSNFSAANSTGTGNLVFATSPTLTTPVITSLVGQNSNTVSTPYSGTGLIPGEMVFRLNADRAGTLTTSAQSVFGVGITLNASTVYQFEGLYVFTKLGATTGAVSTLFAGTATVNNIGFDIFRFYDTASFTNAVQIPASWNYVQVTTAVSTTATIGTNSYQMFKLRGMVSINAGGTFIPQIQTATAASGTLTFYANSYFKLSPLAASGANTNIGGWA